LLAIVLPTDRAISRAVRPILLTDRPVSNNTVNR
jgi:hypothetical protein